MIDRQYIVNEFYKLEEKAEIINLQEHVSVYLIGGGNLALRGVKESTKDIDIIVKNKTQFSLLTKVFETPIHGRPIYLRQYKSEWDYNLGMSVRYKHPSGDYFIDVFIKRVLGGLYLSKNMIQRAEIIPEFSQHRFFKIYLISKEDIFLFKCVTSLERIRDTEDLITLIEMGLDYNLIIEELKHQLSKNPDSLRLKTLIQNRIENILEYIGEIKGLKAILQYLNHI